MLSDYDVVLDTQGGETLNKSAQILKQGGKIISLAGAPDPKFAKEFGANWIVKTASPLLSHKIRRLVAKKNASYAFLFMRADGKQLYQITQLIEAGIIKPVIDRTFNFSQTQKALDYVAQGHSKGKVVITLLDVVVKYF